MCRDLSVIREIEMRVANETSGTNVNWPTDFLSDLSQEGVGYDGLLVTGRRKKGELRKKHVPEEALRMRSCSCL